MWLLQNCIQIPQNWGPRAHNLPCGCPRFPVCGLFEAFESLPGICGSPIARLLWEGCKDVTTLDVSTALVQCRPPKKHVHAKFRMCWPYSTHAEMVACACTQNLLGSRSFWLNWTCAIGLTFLRNRLSIFHVCNCSEVSQMHQFPCLCIICTEILDRNMGILPLIWAALGKEETSVTLY